MIKSRSSLVLTRVTSAVSLLNLTAASGTASSSNNTNTGVNNSADGKRRGMMGVGGGGYEQQADIAAGRHLKSWRHDRDSDENPSMAGMYPYQQLNASRSESQEARRTSGGSSNGVLTAHDGGITASHGTSKLSDTKAVEKNESPGACLSEDEEYSKALLEYYNMRLIVPTWRLKEKMKTMGCCLILALNIGTDPPDAHKPSPCAKLQTWFDPTLISRAKAREKIGERLETQYARWQQRAKLKYKRALDPTMEDVRSLCISMRRNAKQERLLLHYNGHGVPRPTKNGEIWLFDKNHTQYIPCCVSDVKSWIGRPSIVVLDCSGAGVLMPFFETNEGVGSGAKEMENRDNAACSSARATTAQEEPVLSPSEAAAKSVRDYIVFCPCAENELLPMNPEFPADIFTSCLTTPIPIALRWFIRQNPLSMGDLNPEMVDCIPGQINDRKTPLGELNWIFTAVTDTIAWNVLPSPLFQRLFRQDLLVASMFRNFLLADRIMRSLNCTPTSMPPLPAGTSCHGLWSAWDLAVEGCLSGLMREGLLGGGNTIMVPMAMPSAGAGGNSADDQKAAGLRQQVINPSIQQGQQNQPPTNTKNSNNTPNSASPFFAEQLTAFQIWLDFASSSNTTNNTSNSISNSLQCSPEQLPVVLQVLLSQPHRVRALILLRQFLDLGPWAVNLALTLGIFPYVLKLLQSQLMEYKHVLIGIWAKILSFDPSCQLDLVEGGALNQFIDHLNWGLNKANSTATTHNTEDAAEQRIMAAFILSAVTYQYPHGKAECVRLNLLSVISTLLQSTERHSNIDDDENGQKKPTNAAATQNTQPPEFKLWLCICIANLVQHDLNAQRKAYAQCVHLRLFACLEDDDLEVRTAAAYALGALIGTDDHAGADANEEANQTATTAGVGVGVSGTGGGAAVGGSMAPGSAINSLNPSNFAPQMNIPNNTINNNGINITAVPQQMQPSTTTSSMQNLPPWQHAMQMSVQVPSNQFNIIANSSHMLSQTQVTPQPQQQQSQQPQPQSAHTRRLTIDLTVAHKLITTTTDASPTVRYESILALGCAVGKYLTAFAAVAHEIGFAEGNTTHQSDTTTTTATTENKEAEAEAEATKTNIKMSPKRPNRSKNSMSINSPPRNKETSTINNSNSNSNTNKTQSNKYRPQITHKTNPLLNTSHMSSQSISYFDQIWTALRNSQHNDPYPIVASAANSIVSVVHEHILMLKTYYEQEMALKEARHNTDRSGGLSPIVSSSRSASPKDCEPSSPDSVGYVYVRHQSLLSMETAAANSSSGPSKTANVINTSNTNKNQYLMQGQLLPTANNNSVAGGGGGMNINLMGMTGIKPGEHQTQQGPFHLHPTSIAVPTPFVDATMQSSAFIHSTPNLRGGNKTTVINTSVANAEWGPTTTTDIKTEVGVGGTALNPLTGETMSTHDSLFGRNKPPQQHQQSYHHPTALEQQFKIQYSLPKSRFYLWKRMEFGRRRQRQPQQHSSIDDPLSPAGSIRAYYQRRNYIVHEQSSNLAKQFVSLAPKPTPIPKRNGGPLGGNSPPSQYFRHQTEEDLLKSIDMEEINSAKEAALEVEISDLKETLQLHQIAIIHQSNNNTDHHFHRRKSYASKPTYNSVGKGVLPTLLSFHPYEPILIVCDASNKISVWDYMNKEKLGSLSNHNTKTNCATTTGGTAANNTNNANTRMTCVSWINQERNSLLLTGSDDGVIRIWDNIVKPMMNASLNPLQPELISAFHAAPDLVPGQRGSGLVTEWQQFNGYVLAGGTTSVLRCWDLEMEKCVNTLNSKSDACVTTLTTAWDSLDYLNQGEGASSALNKGQQGAGEGFSGIGPNIVVAGYGDGSMRVFDIRVSHLGSVASTAARAGDSGDSHPNTAAVTSTNTNSTNAVNNFSGGGFTRKRRRDKLMYYREHSSWIVDTFFTGYGGRYEVISGCLSGDVKAWDLRFSSSLRTLDVQRSPMTAMAVHPRVPLLATGSHAQFIKILTLDGDTLHVIRYHEHFTGQRIGPVSCLAFHPHKMLLATGATDEFVSIYSTEKNVS